VFFNNEKILHVLIWDSFTVQSADKKEPAIEFTVAPPGVSIFEVILSTFVRIHIMTYIHISQNVLHIFLFPKIYS